MVRARSPGVTLSDVSGNNRVTTNHLNQNKLSIYETHQIPVLKCDQDQHQVDNIRLVETSRIDFILLSVSARITAYITAAAEQGGRVRLGVNKHFTIEVSSACSHANMTPDQDQQHSHHASSSVDTGFMWLGLNYSLGKVD